MITPVLLCGGSGTRLWPLSRKSYPKQFARLIGDESLFQASVRRLSGAGFNAPLVITGNDFRFIVVEQLNETHASASQILIEPAPRSTAPAVLASALVIGRSDPSALMLVAPSDHVIPDGEAFRASVAAAAPRAISGDIVTFGIVPTRAETGYGYLELPLGAPLTEGVPQPLMRFLEKPNRARAEQMVEAGNFLWNAGIFLLSVETALAAYRAYAPDVLAAVEEAVAQASTDLSFIRLDAEAWSDVPDISIDYAIMEKATNLAVMPYLSDWSDLGGWDAIWAHSEIDHDGTAEIGNATAIDCRGTLLRTESDRVQLVGIGLTDIVAVAMPDAVLVAHKSQVQDVKEAVSTLKKRGIAQAESFPTDYRPWGLFESLVMGKRFQVKRILVKPGGALSLQSHNHRAEHWIVVEGTARVTVDETTRLVTENESVYIPLGAIHRLENPGKVPLTLIEVQTGTYLGEDDIVRYEDVYSRGQGAKG